MSEIRALKALRTEFNLTQKQCADAVGIPASTFVRKENGNTEFTISEAKRISEYFGKSIKDIFFTNIVTKRITNQETEVS